MVYRSLVCLFILCLSSVAFANQTSEASNEIINKYIDRYKDVAIDEMVRAGIPASIKLAQAILESNAGRSYLAVNGNNHFGIKCGKYWQGRTVMREDDDYKNGKLIKSCFRAFPSVAFSFKAHSEFLLDPKKDFRYGFLFQLPVTDYRSWAKGLKKAGYATDPNYPKRLISLIERFELYQYDQEGLEREIIGMPADIPVAVVEEPVSQTIPTPTQKPTVKPTAPKEETVATRPSKPAKKKADDFFAGESRSYKVAQTNGVDRIKTSKGDNLSIIALETGKDLVDLICYNDFGYSAKESIPAGEIIYLSPKKSKFQGKRHTYRVKKGETAFDIAQKFGIRLKKLRSRNRWSDHYQPKGGEVVYLRGRKKK